MVNPHHEPDITRRIAQFKPPAYDGSADPKKLENWFREFENIFDMVGCPAVMKVIQAVFYFTDQADIWWAQNRDRLNGRMDFSWETFVQAVRSKFYPVHLQKKLTRDFANLTMGSMSVDEYYQKFTELLRFAPMWCRRKK